MLMYDLASDRLQKALHSVRVTVRVRVQSTANVTAIVQRVLTLTPPCLIFRVRVQSTAFLAKHALESFHPCPSRRRVAGTPYSQNLMLGPGLGAGFEVDVW